MMRLFHSTAYTPGPPGYPERNGSLVEVLRQLTAEEADVEVGAMFRIRFSDGVETDAFQAELLGRDGRGEEGGVTDRDERMRRDLAEAMGWVPGVGTRTVWVRPATPVRPEEVRVGLPDPLNSAEDAEALWTHLENEFKVAMFADVSEAICVIADHPDMGSRRVEATVYGWEELDPARRRRRALVEAAWQAVTATREVRDGQDS